MTDLTDHRILFACSTIQDRRIQSCSMYVGNDELIFRITPEEYMFRISMFDLERNTWSDVNIDYNFELLSTEEGCFQFDVVKDPRIQYRAEFLYQYIVNCLECCAVNSSKDFCVLDWDCKIDEEPY